MIPRVTSWPVKKRRGRLVVQVYENVGAGKGVQPWGELTAKEARELAAALVVDAEAVELAEQRREAQP